MPQPQQRPDPVQHAERRAPRPKERLRRNHQNTQEHLGIMAVPRRQDTAAAALQLAESLGV
jgi:hypothetical protein